MRMHGVAANPALVPPLSLGNDRTCRGWVDSEPAIPDAIRPDWSRAVVSLFPPLTFSSKRTYWSNLAGTEARSTHFWGRTSVGDRGVVF
jgi:hypothetical protein